ncbi:EF-hand domain-containing protein [Rhodanobacter sp. MP7CTX1]|uniref:EF-hand domain-containing protein n=1 Tax=Rhodanobacter sp. MP7CTX1 TaxID=2723084 RepID=UPI00160A947B|nr:EF-hand domain-containing protein [Rhodanobacter sp. MP7CTX1]
MKSRKPMLSAITAGVLMFAGTLIAQDAPPPPPPPQAMPAPASTAADAAVGQAPSAQTTQGQTTVASVPPPKPVIGPAPPFEQLSGGSKSITEEQAVAYPPLANDFIHADTNRDGKISKSEYERWTKLPQQ